jgi:DNA-binding CsgD family transcriptional regulator
MEPSVYIDLIYEAGVVPELWPRVLDLLAQLSDGEGTLLFAATPENSRWIASSAIVPMIEKWAASPWFHDNPRGARLVPMREPRFLTDYDALTPEEVEQHPYYTDFLRPNGLGWCVGTAIHSNVGDALVFSVEKAYAKGPVTPEVAQQLDVYRPHLARAALLSARIGLERARVTAESFALIGLPAVVLTPSGRVLAANERLTALEPRIGIGGGDQIRFMNPLAQAMFMGAIQSAGQIGGAGKSIPVAGDGVYSPMVAHLLPLRGSGRDIFSGAASVLFITEISRQEAPHAEILQTLYDLTPAEARVARLLVDGGTVETVSVLIGISRNTVRMHLKGIFSKTGVNRQSELVRLLAMPKLSI